VATPSSALDTDKFLGFLVLKAELPGFRGPDFILSSPIDSRVGAGVLERLGSHALAPLDGILLFLN